MRYPAIIFAFAFSFAFAFGVPAYAGELTVSAAISLKEALSKLGAQFEQAHKGTQVFFNFGASGELARQIERGAGADVFISAARDQMDQLVRKDLVEKTTVTPLLSNRLVVIVPQSQRCISNLKELAKLNRIAIGNPATVPAGTYAKQALEKAGVWQALDSAKKLVYGESVRQVLTYVDGANVDAGLVYQTDVHIAHNVKPCLAVPTNLTQPILYPAAVVKGSQNAQLANEFVKFLISKAARRTFKQAGFALP